jgi:hypothetical protein
MLVDYIEFVKYGLDASFRKSGHHPQNW